MISITDYELQARIRDLDKDISLATLALIGQYQYGFNPLNPGIAPPGGLKLQQLRLFQWAIGRRDYGITLDDTLTSAILSMANNHCGQCQI